MDVCDVTAVGCVELAAGLTENTTLRLLNIQANAIGMEGAKAVGKMLETNRVLETINLNADGSLGIPNL